MRQNKIGAIFKVKNRHKEAEVRVNVHCWMCREEKLRVFLQKDEQIDLEAVVAAVFKDVEHFHKHFLSCPRLHDLEFLLIRLLGKEEPEQSIPVL